MMIPRPRVAMSMHWEHFPHEAHMGVRGVGPTQADAFEQAALAMMAVVTDLAAVEQQQMVRIECEAPDEELLLVRWLNSLVHEMSARKMLFSRFVVQLNGTHLKGQAWGERLDRERHHSTAEIRGVTYTSLRVARHNGQWVAQTVVDV